MSFTYFGIRLEATLVYKSTNASQIEAQMAVTQYERLCYIAHDCSASQWK
ncbi:uncharacterized protein PHALS_00869 [Plasmopara halstedii]|uniref:Uncharacterized protein n=1 Tax=Plasmopara halstedii TaxID=4781 RepID=A0A0P1AUE7_PLAHL|nr:uncharacterized protein PHALS_00869 [Plasmopara halstedii]CEG44510.1 hypothetical protein PHALS_00869 [Plasmopara halstedii]|eukprot:XP_024580879.1 hypothetical protein PHALS_00869 [Plasmopara halstedii]